MPYSELIRKRLDTLSLQFRTMNLNIILYKVLILNHIQVYSAKKLGFDVSPAEQVD